MSSGDPATRERILTAARRLLERTPGANVSMAEIAAEARVSRQALYLHFRDRTALFLDVSRMADAMARTPTRQRKVDDAPTGREALRETVALQAWLKPRLQGIATALDALRRTDPAAQAAWKEREQARLQRCEQVVRRLDAEGDLTSDLDIRTAAQCLWAFTSQRVWDDLVTDQGWSTTRYRTHLTQVLEAMLLRKEMTISAVQPQREAPARHPV